MASARAASQVECREVIALVLSEGDVIETSAILLGIGRRGNNQRKEAPWEGLILELAGAE